MGPYHEASFHVQIIEYIYKITFGNVSKVYLKQMKLVFRFGFHPQDANIPISKKKKI
jgi:hypothetical protein